MTHKKQTLLLGAHLSVAGGLEEAIYRGESIGCTTIQLFTKSNRRWFAKPLTQEAIATFRQAVSESNIESLVAHAAYLINLGSPKREIRQKSVQALKEEFSRCEQLGIAYLVLHPGSRGDSSETESLDLIATQLDEVAAAIPGKSMILLETMAGQGSNLCHRFEQIAYVYNKITHKERIGVCFDTCHVFAAGYDLRTEKKYQAVWDEFDRTIGLSRLKVIHINDSKKELGSRVDRHEHIGKGLLGSESFRLLFNDKRFFAIPKILETPKKHLSEDLMNMKTIGRLLSKLTKKMRLIKIAVKDEETESK